MPTPAQMARLEGAMLEAYLQEQSEKITDPERLREVYGTDFADGDTVAKATSLAQMTVAIFDVAACQVNVIDAQRVRTIAFEGGSADVLYQDSYCQHVVGSEGPFIVNNSPTHALVCRNELANEMGIKSYLGVPLVINNQIIGSFCVFDMKPKVWTPADVTMLTGLSQVLTRFIEAKALASA